MNLAFLILYALGKHGDSDNVHGVSEWLSDTFIFAFLGINFLDALLRLILVSNITILVNLYL
jgi:hypothetical protein